MSTASHVLTPLKPFGVVVGAAGGDDGYGLPGAEEIRDLTHEYRVVVLRGFRMSDEAELIAYARRLGPVLSWNFGEVLDLVAQDSPKDYVFTPGRVPYHWDGAFAAAAPAHQLFQCLRAPAPGTGGSTVFCDTTLVLDGLPDGIRDTWDRLRITYRKEKTAHYGGHITVPLIRPHPRTGEPVVRYAEPLAPEEFLSPLHLEIEGLPAGTGPEEFFADIHERLYAPEVTYLHTWQDGDFVVTDNHALLHGRSAFAEGSPRHLRRVHIL